jgi:hypothetical protein
VINNTLSRLIETNQHSSAVSVQTPNVLGNPLLTSSNDDSNVCVTSAQARAAISGKAALGNIAKSQAIRKIEGKKTLPRTHIGRIANAAKKLFIARRNNRDLSNVQLRYKRLDTLSSLLSERDSAGHETNRVARCMKYIVPGRDNVKVFKKDDGSCASYKGLEACSNFWVCPCCSARIAEQRRREFLIATSRPMYSRAMITYTVRHSQYQSLIEIRKALIKSYKKLCESYFYKELCKKHKLRHTVRTLEVRYGANGWHVHMHVVCFFEESVVARRELEAALAEKWQAITYSEGENGEFGASLQNGVDVTVGDEKITAYVRKFGREPKEREWDIDHELTKANLKASKTGESLTFFDLVDLAGGGCSSSAALVKEYAAGMKHQKFMVWSRGFKAECDFSEVSDELSEEEFWQDEDEFIVIDNDSWRAIRKLGLRGDFLQYCCTYSREECLAYLREIRFLHSVYCELLQQIPEKKQNEFSSESICERGSD